MNCGDGMLTCLICGKRLDDDHECEEKALKRYDATMKTDRLSRREPSLYERFSMGHFIAGLGEDE